MKKKKSTVRTRHAGSKKTSSGDSGFQPLTANVKVIGIGGGGGHAVARMARDFFKGVDFVAINTDHQDLDHCDVRQKLYIGKNLTRGLGTGMNPDLGKQAAEENRSEIAELVRGADLVFLACRLRRRHGNRRDAGHRRNRQAGGGAHGRGCHEAVRF